jgi:hypothetical protein
MEEQWSQRSVWIVAEEDKEQGMLPSESCLIRQRRVSFGSPLLLQLEIAPFLGRLLRVGMPCYAVEKAFYRWTDTFYFYQALILPDEPGYEFLL